MKIGKVHIYIWRRKQIQKGRPDRIMYGAELTWPTEREGEWYSGYWVYTPLFTTEGAAKAAANRLAKVIDESGIE